MSKHYPKPTPAPSCAMSLTAACFRRLQCDGRVTGPRALDQGEC
jgi:hypothetical protein